MCVPSPLGGQKRGVDGSSGTGFSIFVNHHVMLGIQSKFSARAVNALYHQASSPVPKVHF